jgi:hypothetical protein
VRILFCALALLCAGVGFGQQTQHFNDLRLQDSLNRLRIRAVGGVLYGYDSSAYFSGSRDNPVTDAGPKFKIDTSNGIAVFEGLSTTPLNAANLYGTVDAARFPVSGTWNISGAPLYFWQGDDSAPVRIKRYSVSSSSDLLQFANGSNSLVTSIDSSGFLNVGANANIGVNNTTIGAGTIRVGTQTANTTTNAGNLFVGTPTGDSLSWGAQGSLNAFYCLIKNDIHAIGRMFASTALVVGFGRQAHSNDGALWIESFGAAGAPYLGFQESKIMSDRSGLRFENHTGNKFGALSQSFNFDDAILTSGSLQTSGSVIENAKRVVTPDKVTAGSGISLVTDNAAGTVEITNSGVTSVSAGVGIDVDSSTGNVTVSAAALQGGTATMLDTDNFVTVTGTWSNGSVVVASWKTSDGGGGGPLKVIVSEDTADIIATSAVTGDTDINWRVLP